MKSFRGSALAAALLVATSGLASAQQVVRYTNVGARGFDLLAGPLAPRETRLMTQPAVATPAGDPVCGAAALAWQGEPMPAGETGTLDTLAFARPATLDDNGRIAFVSQVDGATRNQGVFVADDNGVRVIAMGCGDGGGSGSSDTCGDPSPIGGTFSGLFPDTWAAPATNDNGDVLFVSDVAGGSAPRGLFLYVAASDSIIKIAAVGDASPLGGTLSAIGPGSINNAGTVAFLASTGGDGSQGSDILLWDDGTVTAYVAVGDPAPGGG
ncbi:MAG TPA: choice-of-anchor tandem repeat NxxGxxAF-containing protein, partial [Rhodanobacteraceae bacterium]|nr:choice-of-anchor tandem repeat NxxGxxAF-containing protein [Rhodanobacteraceae bacterium]